MLRSFNVAMLSLVALAASALVLPMLPMAKTAGSALAQAQPSGISMLNPMTIIRMQKSRTEGPGMKVLEKDAEKFCVDCHRGHKRKSAKRSKRAKR